MQHAIWGVLEELFLPVQYAVYPTSLREGPLMRFHHQPKDETCPSAILYDIHLQGLDLFVDWLERLPWPEYVIVLLRSA